MLCQRNSRHKILTLSRYCGTSSASRLDVCKEISEGFITAQLPTVYKEHYMKLKPK